MFESATLRAGNQLLGGVATVSIDGSTVRVVEGLKYSVSNLKRESQAGMDGIHGFTETPIAPFIEFTGRDGGEILPAQYRDLVDATVTVRLANGKTVTGIAMWTTEPQEVETEKGTFRIRFEGGTVLEA